MKKRLTDTAIRKAKPSDRVWSMWDTDVPGLFVEIKTNGNKVFKSKVLRGSRRNSQKSLGKTEAISLEDARRAAEEFLDDTPYNARPNLLLKDLYDRFLSEQLQKYNIDAADKFNKWHPTVNNQRTTLLRLRTHSQ